MKGRAYIVLALILAVSAFLRFRGIFAEGFAFTYDVGRDLLVVRKMFTEHHLTLLGPTTGIEGIFYGPWWYYLLAFPYLIFSGNPTGIAVFIGLLGLTAVLLAYIFGKLLWPKDKNAPFILAAVCGISQVMVSSSNQIWSPNLIPFLMIIWLILLAKQKYLPLGLITGLILESEVAFGTFFLIAQIVALMGVYRKIRWSYFLGLAIIFSPRLIFDLRHDFLVTKNILKLIQQPPVSAGFNLWHSLAEKFIALQGTWNNTLANGNFVAGSTLFIFVLIILIKYYRRLSKTEQQLLTTTLVVCFLIYLFFSFWPGDFWWYYLAGLPVIFIFWLALSIRVSGYYGLAVIYLLFLLQPIKLITSLGEKWEGNAAVYRNSKRTAVSILDQADGQPFNLLVYTPPVIPHTYNYLFSWLSDTHYSNLPQQENQPLIFVILEPDYEHPERLADWLQIHQFDGKIVEERIMPGQIIVQKRIRQ